MGWLIVYLISIIVVPLIYGGLTLNYNDNKIVLSNGESCFGLAVVMVLWPLFIPHDAITRSMKAYRNHVKEKLEKLCSQHATFDKDGFDRERMVTAPEADIKYMLWAYRKKYFKLEAKAVEILRDELLHRNMERNLLK